MSKSRNLYFTNRKEYYRRKRISESLKAYYRGAKQLKTRSRQQVVYNSEYAVSIRAIGFNNQFTEKQLTDRLDEVLNSNPQLLNIPFESEGYENEKIDDEEDANLKEGIIHIEINLRGNTTYV